MEPTEGRIQPLVLQLLSVSEQSVSQILTLFLDF